MLTNTHQGFSVSFVTGSPGSGKSFVCTRDVIYRLINSDVIVRTNLPLEIEPIAAYVAKRKGCSEDDVKARIDLLPSSLLAQWKNWEGGPWDFREQGKAENSELILDECHLFCPATGLGAVKFGQVWTGWLGEVRHEGWRRVVFVTQDETKVGKAIISHSDLRYELTNAERLRDPFLRIPLGDWYELIASFSGRYVPSVTVDEFRRTKGKLRSVHRERVRLDPEWFGYYRSHQAAGGGSREGAVERPKREFEKRPMLLPAKKDGKRLFPTWVWFARRHVMRLSGAAVLAGVVLWFCAFGGVRFVLARAFARAGMDGMGSRAAAVEPEAKAAVPSRGLADVFSSLPDQDRAVIEHALKVATDELKAREEIIKGLTEPGDGSVVDVVPLPRVTAFIGERHVMVQGRRLGVGDFVMLDGGKRRVRVVSIDKKTRSVQLEDSRLLPFRVERDLSRELSQSDGRPALGGPVPAPTAVGVGVQPVGDAASPRGSAAGREKSIVERRTNAAQ